MKKIDPSIKNVFQLEHYTPEGFTCQKFNDSILFCMLEFDEQSKFFKILESIKVDTNLYVQLQIAI